MFLPAMQFLANGVTADWPPVSPVEWVWFTFGMLGNFIFGARFFLQWIHSEKHGESRIPVSFWWLSVIGTLVLFFYFVHKQQWVALLGNGPQLIPYARNLVLIYRKRRENEQAAAVASAESVEPAPSGN